jgi:hypothetical protein
LFYRVSHAAKAFEGCDRSYKAVFAEPKKQKNPYDIYDRFSGSPSTVTSFDSPLSPFSSSMYYAKVISSGVGVSKGVPFLCVYGRTFSTFNYQM